VGAVGWLGIGPSPTAPTLIMFVNLQKIANVKLSIKLQKLTYFNMLNISIIFIKLVLFCSKVDKKALNNPNIKEIVKNMEI